MKKHSKYISLITTLYGQDVKISQPDFVGLHHPIYIAEKNNEKNIIRFSSKECASRNFHVSRLLRKYDIPVPELSFYNFDNQYFETYTFIEGKTLYERHQEGISQEQIKNVYRQLCDICYRMSKIPVKEAENIHLHTCKTDTFFKFLNFSPRVIGHCDLNDKNILLDKNDNVCAILDLDQVELKTFELILINLFEVAKEKGYDFSVESIKDFFPSVYHEKALLNLSQQYEIYKKIVNTKDKILKNKQILQTKCK